MMRKMSFVLCLGLAVAGLAPSTSFASLDLSVEGYRVEAQFYTLDATGTLDKVIDLTPGVAQNIKLDDFVDVFGEPRADPIEFFGSFSTLITLENISQDIWYDYSVFIDSEEQGGQIVHTFSSTDAPPLIFDLGEGSTVTVTPIFSTDVRRASFLLTTTEVAVPEPSTLAVAGTAALAGLAVARLRRRRR